MPVGGFSFRLRANNERPGRHKLALVVLSRPSTRIDSIAILRDKSLRIGFVHRFDEGAFGLLRHRSSSDTQGSIDALKALRQTSVTEFVGLVAKVRIVHAEQVPQEEIGPRDFSVYEKALRVDEVERLHEPAVDWNDLAELADPRIRFLGFLHGEPASIEFLLKPPGRVVYKTQRIRLLDGCEQFRRMAAVFFRARKSDDHRRVAVGGRFGDLIALSCLCPKDPVIDPFGFFVTDSACLCVALQGRAPSAPLRLDGPLVLSAFQLQVVHLVGAALLVIQVYFFGLHDSLLLLWFFAFCAAALRCTKNKSSSCEVPRARPPALSRPRCGRSRERSGRP